MNFLNGLKAINGIISVVEEAENKFGSEKGKEKLEYAIKKVASEKILEKNSCDDETTVNATGTVITLIVSIINFLSNNQKITDFLLDLIKRIFMKS